MLTLKKRGSLPTPTLEALGPTSEGKRMIRDLCLPPLSLPPMARTPSMQPLGSLEAEIARCPHPRSTLVLAQPSFAVPALSALEFLANAAAAAAEEQRQAIPLASIVHP